MNFRTLRTLVEVGRQGGFAQAAKVMFTIRSTVSKAVVRSQDHAASP